MMTSDWCNVHQNEYVLAYQCLQHRDVGTINAVRKPLPLTELRPPLHAVPRAARISPDV